MTTITCWIFCAAGPASCPPASGPPPLLVPELEPPPVPLLLPLPLPLPLLLPLPEPLVLPLALPLPPLLLLAVASRPASSPPAPEGRVPAPPQAPTTTKKKSDPVSEGTLRRMASGALHAARRAPPAADRARNRDFARAIGSI